MSGNVSRVGVQGGDHERRILILTEQALHGVQLGREKVRVKGPRGVLPWWHSG